MKPLTPTLSPTEDCSSSGECGGPSAVNLMTSHPVESGKDSRCSVRVVVLLLLLLRLPVGAAVSDDYTFVHPNGPAEWAAGGDFNGDGLVDAVIVDRLTGAYRIGYQSAGGAMTWTEARSSGIPEVAGFTVGHLFNLNAHGLGFTAEAANRINVVAADNVAQAGVPVSVFIPSAGPNQVMAMDVGGAGSTPLQDLVVASAWNGVAPYRVTTVRNSDGATFSPLQDAAAVQRWDRGNRVVFRQGLAPALAVMARGTNDTLRLISYAGGPVETILQFTNVVSGSDYVAGRFAGTGLMHFLAFRPGTSNLLALPVAEPAPGTFQAGTAAGFQCPGRIESMVVLPAGPGVAAKIFAVFDAGSWAAAFSFDGTNAPVFVQEFAAPEGETLLGATPVENGGVRLHSGRDGRTTQSLHLAFNPGTATFALAHQEGLPPVSDLSARANVFQFQHEPFVAPEPHLLNSGNAGDWSSLFTLLGGPPQVGITSEHYVDATHGLDNPAPVSLGNSHPQTQFGLGNQYTEAVSLFSLAAGAGSQVAEVNAIPPGGLQARSVAVSFSLSDPAFQVLYRLNSSGAWQAYGGKPIPIFTNTTLQFRARSGVSQTAIRTETYSFREGPSTLDSDLDGVPDYAEIANGLDPAKSGSDADGDGYSDLEELLKNTSPTDPDAHPDTPGHEQHAAVDWIITPHPIDGSTGQETAAKAGSRIRVFDLSGADLGAAVIANPPEVPRAASALVTNVFLDARRPLLLATTDLHYDISTPSPDPRLGREMVALLPAPEVPPIRVNYTFGGAAGSLNAEALNWVLAARAAYNSATNEVRSRAMTFADTTLALLFEEKLRGILAATSVELTNVTLFSFRSGDGGRQAFDGAAQEQLNPQKPGPPAYDLRQMYHALDTLVLAAPSPQVKSLHAVAHEVYRLSSASNNAAPGQFRLPLDVLREFIRQGTMHSNYLAAGSFPPVLLGEAAAGVKSVLESLGPRPLTNMLLRLRADTFAGSCTLLETADLAATPVHLVGLGGGRFDFPDTFDLIPGSTVQVVGRPDVSSATCPGLNLEVLSIALVAVPSRSDGDADGNLLIDAWENALLGGLGADPFGDHDGDGYTNLQEMLDGTDPRDRLGRPVGPVANVSVPVLAMEHATDGSLVIEWTWPDQYLSNVEFQILSTSDLNVAPALQPLTFVHPGGNRHRAIVPNPGSNRFFRVSMRLR